jgi:hypothetical protein
VTKWDKAQFSMGYSMTDISQPPPPTNNCSVEGTYANRHMVAVMKNLIGPKTLVGMTKSNIELPGNGEACRSAVCSDAYDDVLPYLFSMEIPIYLRDVSP